jgi:hypothetical protein
VDLLGRRLGIFAELDFGDRHQPGERHSGGAADDPLLVEAGVEHPRASEFLLKPQSDRMDPALGPDVLAEQEHSRIGFQLLLQRPADRRDHVDPLPAWLGLVRRGRRRIAAVEKAADLLSLALKEDMPGHSLGFRDAPRLRFGDGGCDLRRDFALDVVPLLVGKARLRPQLGKRIARPLGRDLVLALVRLRVLGAVPFQPRHRQPKKGRLALLADVRDRAGDELRGLLRLGPVAVEDLEAAEAGEVAAMSRPGVWYSDGTEMP